MFSFHRFDGVVGDHGSWWGFFGTLVPILLLLVLIGVGVWAVLRLSARGPVPVHPAAAAPPVPARPDGALEEVRLRYARGEMSREEFVQRSRDLGGLVPEAGGPPSPDVG